MAAGLSIKPENVDAFRTRLNGIVAARMGEDQLKPRLTLDAEIDLADVTEELIAGIERLQPFGQGNAPVQVVVRNLALKAPPRFIGREAQHARLEAGAGAARLELIWWRCDRERMPTGRFDVAGVPEINEYNGRRSLRLRLLDWRPA